MERPKQSVFHLEQGFELQFRLGPTLQGKEVQVYTNYPAKGHRFDHLQFRPLGWVHPNGCKDDYDKYCQLELLVAGSYQYYFSCGDKQKVSGGYILVDPVLRVGLNDDVLPLDWITAQTYLAPLLGPLDKWLDTFRVAKESGYNMIHVSPLQKLGGSGSCYSVADQLQLNPDFSPDGRQCTWTDVAEVGETLRRQWNMMFISDVVYNHTAADSEWIQLHPECGYNLVNSPQLKPAWLLDRALWHLSCEVADGKLAQQGIPALMDNDGSLTALRAVLWQQVFPMLRLWEFVQVHVDEAVDQFRQLLQAGDFRVRPDPECEVHLTLLPDPENRRFGSTVDLNSALALFPPHSRSPSDVDRSCDSFRRKLEELNTCMYGDMQRHAEQATDCILSTVLYEHLAAQGPRLGPVTREHPLCPRYFTFPFEEMTFDEEVHLMEQRHKACYFLAYDGCVKGDEPIRSCAEPGPDVYLRRELLCQGDAIRLRYGDKPDHCPYLWAQMKKYTQITANVFCGVRLLNCHATPLHVTQAMLAEARSIRPNLYVTAQLCTGSPLTDNVYVKRLGINSLVRGVGGSAQGLDDGAWRSWFGREPVGAFVQPDHRPLAPELAHTFLMDTLEEQSSTRNHSVKDYLPRSALVAMASCAIGSTSHDDELFHHQVSAVMDHQRGCWSSEGNTCEHIHLLPGMWAWRRALNTLHRGLAAQGFTQVSVEQLPEDMVAVTRHCPISHQSVVTVLRRDLSPESHNDRLDGSSISIPGQIKEVVLEAQITEKSTANGDGGVPGYSMDLQEHVPLNRSTLVKNTQVRLKDGGPVQQVVFDRFPPGGVVVFRVTLAPGPQEQLGFLRHHLVQFNPQYHVGSLSDAGAPSVLTEPLASIMSRLTLADINVLLFRCDAEEEEDGGGCYDIPSWMPLKYGGLQGLMSVMAEICPQNHLSHPLCDNLRTGPWMMDYVSQRLLSKGGALTQVGRWFQAMFTYLQHIPSYLVPCYFHGIIQGAHATALQAAYTHMSSFVQGGSSLVKQLALGSVQMCGYSRCQALPTLSPRLEDIPRCPKGDTGQQQQCCVTVAAGLPFSCAGMVRCWGRDTFISLRGLLLLTGRHLEARNIILAFGSTLRYGLIPNALRQGPDARYNCRDAVWWWLQSIQEYCSLVPGGVSILQCPVSRMYPTNVSEPQPAGTWDQRLYEVVQEALQRHMQGIHFTEDVQLETDPGNQDGLTLEAGVDQSTGFVYGGNGFNCGTWMDKMGQSDKAHNQGHPATARDGSAVEIVGLCKSAVRWLVKLYNDGHFPYAAVNVRSGGQTYSVSYVDWDQKIQENFERKFYIPHDGPDPEEVHPELVHKRGIYKDTVGASSPWCDYQLRPNFTIAMTVAPELFTVEKAWEALGVAEEKLLGPLGMKTLDPDDLMYCGVYDSDLDNDNILQAKGFNYHQGPEWVWPLGYFLRAKLYFAKKMGKETFDNSVILVKNVLSRHATYLERSPWKGLPELTDENGQRCRYSCESQASSMASILEVLHDL